MPYVTFFRGTTEPWEQGAIAGGRLRSAREQRWREGGQRDATLQPSASLSYQEINAAIVARVGVETALGTVNTYSHFVPMGTNERISLGFGHGNCFVFMLDCVLMTGRDVGSLQTAFEAAEVQEAMRGGAVPVFVGGKCEFLAYTGTKIVDPVRIARAEDIPNDHRAYLLSKIAPDLEHKLWGI
jgi:hypothetical protein